MLRTISLDPATPAGNIADLFARLTSNYPAVANASSVVLDNGKPRLVVPDIENIGDILMDCTPTDEETTAILSELL